ncbi:NOT2 family protein [Coprinopsis marcescibilis]|uniref:NOT2 family protein n=1 Tax=Coprinopsis marcescibilis TaxID=230819 RepID=A0A5C3L529_COPMA|nr:NOT2 family protein [Coprinopsis marcescibilis]
MNRAGQPQQRGPSLTATPGIATQFRAPFPGGYGLPPRNVNVLQAAGYVPGLQPSNHRTTSQQSVQSMTPQPPGFMQTRAQSSYAFGAGNLGQHQASGPLQQQQISSQQQQQTNGTSTPMLPHLAHSSVIGTPSLSSASEVALDPNDFPALGSTSTNNTSSSTPGNVTSTTSYASHAGTATSLSGPGSGTNAGSIGAAGSGNPPRDFTPDDFPALGGQQHSNQSQNATGGQNSSQDSIPHPPGLNGFQPDFQSRARNLMGDLTSGLQQGTPGLLNIAHTQTRNVHPGFQQPQESEKQQRNGSGQTSLPSHLNPPTGIQPPSGTYTQQQAGEANAANPNGSSHQNAGSNSNSTARTQHPQTPAQQILVSAADRWGLLSLVTLMKTANTELDHGFTSIGSDLGTMGLDMAFSGNLYSTFITPWADQSAAHQVEPDFQLPPCYLSVQAPPPGPAKAALFSDETLFFMFYSSPRDALQEVAAQELWNRNWRWHKDLRLWITKESGTPPSQKVQGGEQGLYTIWEPENWSKEQKELTVLYSDLEEKSQPAFLPGPGLVPSHQGSIGQGQAAAQHAQPGQIAAALQNPSQRAPFQMGVTA